MDSETELAAEPEFPCRACGEPIEYGLTWLDTGQMCGKCMDAEERPGRIAWMLFALVWFGTIIAGLSWAMYCFLRANLPIWLGDV